MLYCYIAVLLYCFIVILLYCYIAVLLYCYIAVLLYCFIAARRVPRRTYLLQRLGIRLAAIKQYSSAPVIMATLSFRLNMKIAVLLYCCIVRRVLRRTYVLQCLGTRLAAIKQ